MAPQGRPMKRPRDDIKELPSRPKRPKMAHNLSLNIERAYSTKKNAIIDNFLYSTSYNYFLLCTTTILNTFKARLHVV